MGASLRCFDCATFLYDPKRKTVCFKSFTSWLLIFSAYLLLFAILAGFWAFTYWMVSPWNLEAPKTYGENSILGRNPGLGVVPTSESNARPSNLYHFARTPANVDPSWNMTGSGNKDFGSALGAYFEVLKQETQGVYCNASELYASRDKNAEACRMNVSLFEPCLSGFDQSRETFSPCFLITVNNIYGFEPTPYGHQDKLPEWISQNVKGQIVDSGKPRQLYIDCDGEHPADREALKGRLKYIPSTQAIPPSMFPFWGSKRAERPFVAVQIVDPQPGQVIRVACRFIFKGADYNSATKRLRGTTVFNVLIE